MWSPSVYEVLDHDVFAFRAEEGLEGVVNPLRFSLCRVNGLRLAFARGPGQVVFSGQIRARAVVAAVGDQFVAKLFRLERRVTLAFGAGELHFDSSRILGLRVGRTDNGWTEQRFSHFKELKAYGLLPG